MVDLRDERGRVLVPAGSVMRGVVSSVNRATRTDRKGGMTIAFDRVTINGRSYPMRATVSQALESEGIMGEKEKIGIGAGVGGILGAILGGGKGALAGILIGGGGTIAATEGQGRRAPRGHGASRADGLAAHDQPLKQGRNGETGGMGRNVRLSPPLQILHRMPGAARIVTSMSFAVCAADRNHASNCDGGG